MFAKRGDIDSHAAIFIYKRDNTIPDALRAALAVATAHRSKLTYDADAKAKVVARIGYDPTEASGRFVHAVVATTKDEFLAALAAWQAAIEENQGALILYAHMGDAGMAPLGDALNDLITWDELGTALPKRVSSLWLAGCESKFCLAAWPRPQDGPVQDWLACTTSSEYWAPLIYRFYAEISLDTVLMPKDVASLLQKEFGTVEYFEAAEGRWAKQ